MDNSKQVMDILTNNEAYQNYNKTKERNNMFITKYINRINESIDYYIKCGNTSINFVGYLNDDYMGPVYITHIPKDLQKKIIEYYEDKGYKIKFYKNYNFNVFFKRILLPCNSLKINWNYKNNNLKKGDENEAYQNYIKTQQPDIKNALISIDGQIRLAISYGKFCTNYNFTDFTFFSTITIKKIKKYYEDKGYKIKIYKSYKNLSFKKKIKKFLFGKIDNININWDYRR